MTDDNLQLDSTEKRDKALDCVRSFMKESKEFRQLKEYIWMRMWAEYLNSRSVKANILQRANLKLPYAWNIIETFTPQIIEAFTAESPYIQAVPRKTWDPEASQKYTEMAESITGHYSYQIEQMKFFEDFTTFVKNMLIYGTAIAKVGWTKNEKMLPARQKRMVDGVETFEKIEQPVTLYEGPTFNTIDIIDFFPYWGATRPGDIQSMPGCCHRVYRTLNDLKAMEKKGDKGIYDNLEDVAGDIKQNGYNAWTEPSTVSVDYPQSMHDYAVDQWPGQKLKGKIEIWEWWGQYEDEDGQMREKVITIANGRTVIRFDDNPYDYGFKPFLACVDHPVPGEFYGEGELQPLYSLFREASALRNARLDQTNQAVNRMFIIDRNAGINVRNFYSRTSGIVLANDINGIKAMDVPEVPGSSYQELSQIDYEIQNASAMINASQATSNLGQAFGNTARGIGFLQGTMTSRMGMKIRNLENMVMRPLGQRLAMLNRQFLSNEMWAEVNGDQTNPFQELSADDFYNSWDFSAVAAIDRINREQRQAMFSQAIIPYLQFVEKSQPGTMNLSKMTQKFFTEFNITDPYSYINPPEVQQQIQNQRTQQQMQVNQHEHDEKTKTLATIEAIKGQQHMERDELKAHTKLTSDQIKSQTNLTSKIIEGGFRDIAGKALQGGIDAARDTIKRRHNRD